jgi:hypothetical protein
MNVREIALDVCKTLSTLAFSAAIVWVIWSGIVWVIWSGHKGPEKENPEKAFEEDIDSIAADARATAEYALAYADAEDLTDTGPGAPERMRAARLVAIRLNLAANEAEREAREAHEADRKAYEEMMESERYPYQ